MAAGAPDSRSGWRYVIDWIRYVALMGQARAAYTFFTHLKCTLVIALGYAASILVHFWINKTCFRNLQTNPSQKNSPDNNTDCPIMNTIRFTFFKLIYLLLFLSGPLLADDIATQQPDNVDVMLQSLTDEQKAAQLIMVYFDSPEYVARHEFGAVLIMQNMIRDADRLTKRLQKLQRLSPIGVITAIDQEGGRVNRLRYLKKWKNIPSATKQAEWEPEKILDYHSQIASQLQDMGVNLNLAPVLDPGENSHGEKSLMGIKQRSFGNSAFPIASSGAAFSQAYRDKQILTISKHFPGYDSASNSDHEIAKSNASRHDLQQYIQPFWALSPIVDGVMLSSIEYKHLSSKPAVFSKSIVGWARQIYPDKIIITDDLWGRALRAWINPVSVKRKNYPDSDFLRLTRMALDAGNDVLMITYPQKAELMKKAIAKWIKEDQKLEAHVNAAVRRILVAKQRIGLIE